MDLPRRVLATQIQNFNGWGSQVHVTAFGLATKPYLHHWYHPVVMTVLPPQKTLLLYDKSGP